MKEAEKLFTDLNVAICEDEYCNYPDEYPYHPDTNFLEYRFKNHLSSKNSVYKLVRDSLCKLGLDFKNIGNENWNPFKNIIKPGNTVLLKPNFVISEHPEGKNLYSIITHPAVLRAVVDYAYIALNGNGKIIIADAPQMDCNFNQLLEITKLESIKKFYKEYLNFDIEIYDLRKYWINRNEIEGEIKSNDRKTLPGDPLGGVKINLGKKSLLYEKSNENYYGADYNREECKKHHHGTTQEYYVSKTILSADAVISVPKLKTHKKVGVTLNAKGLVGININKNYLVHFTVGSPKEGGDEYFENIYNRKQEKKIKLKRWAIDKFLSKKNVFGDFLFDLLKKMGKIFLSPLGYSTKKTKNISGGNWYGNDSAWRMTIDLLRLFIYVNMDGKLMDTPQRKLFSIVDGIIGGEGDGPLSPESKPCGIIISGFNFCAVDIVCTRIMGFDIDKIKKIKYMLENKNLFHTKLDDIKINSNKNYDNLFDKDTNNKYYNFKPHRNWLNHIEIDIK